MCEAPEAIVKDNVKTYVDASAAFFGAHYTNDRNAVSAAPEESILVLIAGMAPAIVDKKVVEQQVVEGALKVLSTAAVADPKIADEKKNFALVLKAGYLFNKAAEKVDDKVRYTAPRVSSKMTAKDRSDARTLLQTAINILKDEVKEEALNDRQKEFLRVLRGAAAGFLKSLDDRPPPPPPPSKPPVIIVDPVTGKRIIMNKK
jgi:hypothetical protein